MHLVAASSTEHADRHRGVLQQRDHGARQRRQRGPERLGEHDVRITPPNGRPIGAGRLGLADRHGVDARAQRLAHEAGGVERQADDGTGEGVGHPDVAPAGGDDDVDELELDADLRGGDGQEQQDEQQRGVAHQDDVGGRGAAHHGYRTDPQRHQHGAEHDRTDAGEDEQQDGRGEGDRDRPGSCRRLRPRGLLSACRATSAAGAASGAPAAGSAAHWQGSSSGGSGVSAPRSPRVASNASAQVPSSYASWMTSLIHSHISGESFE